ncbi:MAG: S9 family peptidase [Enterobacterales bacterium]|nr:S9 family peptidase [Enterobacterales bacterium]
MREYTYQARDGLSIPTLLTYPLAHVNKPENMPAILMPHGGPQSHDKFGFQWMAQYFANRGYLVIQPQFRGSSGFGHELTRQGYGEWGKKMQDDLTDGVNHLAKKGMIDPDKVCIVGWSYGGYAALAGASFTPELFKCAISINGVSDLEEMMRTEKREHGRNHWVVSYWNKVIANQKVADDFMESISPINHVKKITAPVLLIHGEDDNVVPVDQSEEMADALESADKKFKFIEIKDEGHSINYSNVSRLTALKAIDEFLSANMK